MKVFVQYAVRGKPGKSHDKAPSHEEVKGQFSFFFVFRCFVVSSVSLTVNAYLWRLALADPGNHKAARTSNFEAPSASKALGHGEFGVSDARPPFGVTNPEPSWALLEKISAPACQSTSPSCTGQPWSAS